MNSDSNARPIVITSTAPTPNGPLHVGHLSGPYLAADIAARALQARGQDVVRVGGLDPNQNYVVTKAAAQGRSTDDLLDDYCGRIRNAWATARIPYDVFVDPQHDAAYGPAVAGLISALLSRGAVQMVETSQLTCPSCRRTMHHAYVAGQCPVCAAPCSGGTCEGCASFVTAQNLVGARCARCGIEPDQTPALVPVLRLEDYRDQLVEVWSRATLSPRIRALLERYLERGLPDIPLAYATDWGIPWTSPEGRDLRVDVWVEMGLGYLFTLARHFDADLDRHVAEMEPAAAYVEAWSKAGKLWHFLGIDNAFYYSVLFPALFVAAGMPVGSLGGIVVNEFYRLEGRKFSTSRGHAVWADELLAEEDPAWVRLYLCWDRPDCYESDFTRERYDAFRRHFERLLSEGSEQALPGALADQEIVRARHALDLENFDAALAVRCALTAAAVGQGSARDVLALLASEDVPVLTRA